MLTLAWDDVSSWFIVTVSVAPTAVVIALPPAISNVFPWAIVWSLPPSPVNVKVVNWFVLVSETVLVNVILSLDLAILSPVPASKTTSSVDESLPVNLIFSSSLLSPSTQETLYVVFASAAILAFTILLFESNPKLLPLAIVPESTSSKYTSLRNLAIKSCINCPINFILLKC